MIERMKKLTFLVTDQEYDSFLAGLREQGVVHVQQLKQGATSPALQEAIDLKQRIQQDLAYLEYAWGTWGKHTHMAEPVPARMMPPRSFFRPATASAKVESSHATRSSARSSSLPAFGQWYFS